VISLILPYYNRQQATDKALQVLAAYYKEADLEVIVVDDGDPVPFKVKLTPWDTPVLPLNIKVIRLPVHDYPRSPLAAWNAGVEAASGEMIALSQPEVLHPGPVLVEMAAELERLGPDGYVLAAAWCPEQNRWHTHSTLPVPDCPPGTGLGFLSLLYRELYERVGGFDEAYLGGAGYEDRDFIWRLWRAGAQFRIRDDLVVVHPKTGAKTYWKPEGFVINEAIFRKKWC